MRGKISFLFVSVAGGLALFALAGCSNDGTVQEVRSLPAGSSLLTSADVRTVNRTEVSRDSDGRITKPESLICAEPSPDIAKVVSASFGASVSAEAQGLQGVDPKLAAAITRARSEGLAQLTERLATIQLLRDGLYRACEAYVNGAISETTYAVMISRYDDTMVSMLLGEFAAGAFGRQLAALGGGAEGEGSAMLDFTEKQSESREAESELNEALSRNEAAKEALEEASEGGESDTTSLQREVEESRRLVTERQEELIEKLRAEVKAAANVTELRPGGAIEPGQSPEIAKTLAQMQQNYMENINFDAVVVGCMTALDRATSTPRLQTAISRYRQAQIAYRDESADDDKARDTASSELAQASDELAEAANESKLSALGAYCLSGILPRIADIQGDVLAAILNRRKQELETQLRRAEPSNAIDAANSYIEKLRELLDRAESLSAE